MKYTKLITALYKIIVADFKAVEVKFLDQGVDKSEIDDYFKDFKELKNRNKIDDPDERNIDFWGKKTWEEFKEFVSRLKLEKSRTEEKKLKKMEGAELAGENEYWYVYRILTHDAAKVYGANTRWCITQSEDNHWKQYSGKNNIYFIIFKKPELLKEGVLQTNNQEKFSKIAVLVDSAGKKEYWDALDNKVNKPYVSEIKDGAIHTLGFPDVDYKPFVTMVPINNKMYLPDEIPDNTHVKHSLSLTGTGVTKLPNNLRVDGHLNLDSTAITEIPKSLSVTGDLLISDLSLTNIPALECNRIICDRSKISGEIDVGIKCNFLSLRYTKLNHIPKFPNVKSLDIAYAKVETIDLDPTIHYLDISGMSIKRLPAYNLMTLIAKGSRLDKIDPNLKVTNIINMFEAKIKKLPDNISCNALFLDGSNLKELPKNLKVHNLSIRNTSIRTLNVEGLVVQSKAFIEGSEVEDVGDLPFEKLYSSESTFLNSRLKKLPPMEEEKPINGLNLAGSLIEELPPKLIIDGDLILISMPQLKKLPKVLKVKGTLSIVRTGITELPAKLEANVLIMDKDLEVPKSAKINFVHIK